MPPCECRLANASAQRPVPPADALTTHPSSNGVHRVQACVRYETGPSHFTFAATRKSIATRYAWSSLDDAASSIPRLHLHLLASV